MDRAQSRGGGNSTAPSPGILPPDVAETLRREAEAAWPRECCGLLLGGASTRESLSPAHIVAIAPSRNVARDPWRHFEIDPVTLIAAHRTARAGGPPVLGYYHSHPTGVAVPSAIDQAEAPGDGAIWAIIACAPPTAESGRAKAGDISLWVDGPNGFVALSTRRVEG